MDSKKYHEKLETMVNEGIKNGIYKETIVLYMIVNYFKTSYSVTLKIIKITKKGDQFLIVLHGFMHLPRPINLII